MAAAAVVPSGSALIATAPSSLLEAALAVPAASSSTTRSKFDEQCGTAMAEVATQLTSIYSGNGSWSMHLCRDISALSHLLSGRLTPAAALVQWRSSSEDDAMLQRDDVVSMLGLREWNPPNLAAQVAAIPFIDEDGAHEQCMTYEFLLEILTDLLAARAATLSKLHQFASQGDFMRFRQEAHALYGAAANLHLPAFANVADRMRQLGLMGARNLKDGDTFRWQTSFSPQEWKLMQAMNGEQNAQLDSLLRAAQESLIVLLAAQYDRLESYLPRLRELSEEEQIWIEDLEQAREIPSWAGA
jgi:HPt (histidine-containing phosphotransfer) domain-containing protein